jgi:5-methylcytosine-specific restriction endonuclease McrA
MFCSPHKGALKAEVDNWKMGKGCENKDLRHGFLCTSHITDVTQLDVNHRDGNRHNQDPDNLEILCKICHQRVTMDNKHHVNRYRHEVILNPDLFEF